MHDVAEIGVPSAVTSFLSGADVVIEEASDTAVESGWIAGVTFASAGIGAEGSGCAGDSAGGALVWQAGSIWLGTEGGTAPALLGGAGVGGDGTALVTQVLEGISVLQGALGAVAGGLGGGAMASIVAWAGVLMLAFGGGARGPMP